MELWTCVLLVVKAQRIRSAKFMLVRAPMTSAPMMANRTRAYMPSAERRVNSHICASKCLRPRWLKESVRDFVVIVSLRPRCG